MGHSQHSKKLSRTVFIDLDESNWSKLQLSLVKSAGERSCTLSNKPTEQNKKKSVQDMIDEVIKPEGPKDAGKTPPKPAPKPAELDQDPGGGYNPDHTYPQT